MQRTFATASNLPSQQSQENLRLVDEDEAFLLPDLVLSVTVRTRNHCKVFRESFDPIHFAWILWKKKKMCSVLAKWVQSEPSSAGALQMEQVMGRTEIYKDRCKQVITEMNKDRWNKWLVGQKCAKKQIAIIESDSLLRHREQLRSQTEMYKDIWSKWWSRNKCIRTYNASESKRRVP